MHTVVANTRGASDPAERSGTSCAESIAPTIDSGWSALEHLVVLEVDTATGSGSCPTWPPSGALTISLLVSVSAAMHSSDGNPRCSIAACRVVAFQCNSRLLDG